MPAASHPSMLPRFDGADGKRHLADVLLRQTLLSPDVNLASLVADCAQLIEVMPGDRAATIITQGGADNDIYFIISGSVTIYVNGREVARRFAGNHVGEMALIDRTARRSATVVAAEPTLLAQVSEAQFSRIANAHPELWRGLAVEIGNRLRERNSHIRQPHNQAEVFIGCSSEQLDIAQEIQLRLSHDPMVVRVWTDNVFKASRTSIENLISAVGDADFAVLVISPDDDIVSRGSVQEAPRDNVVFELGLFMGGLGRERTFLARPRGVDIKIPTDLFGVTPLDYAIGDKGTLSARIAPLCTELRRTVLQLGPK